MLRMTIKVHMLRRMGRMFRKTVINNLWRRALMLRKRINMLRELVINNLMRRRVLMLRKRVNMLGRRKRRWLMLRCCLWTNEGLEQVRRWGSGK